MDNNYIEDIKLIIQNFIEMKYKKYLFDEEILTIENKKLQDIICRIYDNNIKTIKKEIRDKLKEKYQNEYSSLKVENIIIYIFNDKKSNINKIVEEILFIQNSNIKFITIPIVNNSLNLNISLVDNYLVINSTNINLIKDYENIYNKIKDYKFLYQINNKILQDYNNTEKINIIKSEILNKSEIEIGIYYKKLIEKL